ncbi:tyrosine-type recombinase/integrase [Halodesulfovibrio aestuarii]|uniref:tyrosine-type recombinase/integrase n=1 Tax=Halodesulfovibrio aestuarii TaxID=126333 RepID=UPI003D3451E9
MAGRRPLSQEEVRRCKDAFGGRFHVRDRCLFTLGVCSGFRIMEMLSLRVRDVVVKGRVRNAVEVRRKFMKGKKQSRIVDLSPQAQEVILAQVKSLTWASPETYLFKAQGNKNKPLSYERARMVLLDTLTQNGVVENIGTHSLRKTFSNELMEELIGMQRNGANIDPVVELSKALGHCDIKSTMSYISFRNHHRKAAIKSIGALFD